MVRLDPLFFGYFSKFKNLEKSDFRKRFNIHQKQTSDDELLLKSNWSL